MLILRALATNPALASGGVLEINQSCAVNTGCFTGDSAGFPVEIKNPEVRGNLSYLNSSYLSALAKCAV